MTDLQFEDGDKFDIVVLLIKNGKIKKLRMNDSIPYVKDDDYILLKNVKIEKTISSNEFGNHIKFRSTKSTRTGYTVEYTCVQDFQILMMVRDDKIVYVRKEENALRKSI